MADASPSFKRIKSEDVGLADSTDDTVVDSTRSNDLLREASDAIQESNRLHFKPVIEESKLGIEIFVGDVANQFHGLIKSRYSDFIVHEIDLDGNIVQLTSTEPPEDEEESDSLKPRLENFLEKDAIDCLMDVNDGHLESYKISVTGMDKDIRTSIHQAIRAAHDRLESSYSNSPDLNESYIVVTRRNKASRIRNTWPRNRPDYTHFILYKENRDTMDAIHLLASATNMRPANFCFAGTKDRRAVTSQLVSAWRLDPKKLLNSVRRYNKRPFLKVGNFSFKKDPLKLGQLSGNKFDIVIRHLVHNSEGIKVIQNSMESIKKRGFVNYFGLQRFGTRSSQTHHIGLAILRGCWDKAVDLILSYKQNNLGSLIEQQDKQAQKLPVSSEAEDTSASQDVKSSARQKNDPKRLTNNNELHNLCIDLWKTKLDADLVFKKYPQFRFTNEGLIIRSLHKSDKSGQIDHLGALASLPRNTRSMYVHSYQSIVFNKLATYRLKKYGFNVIPGDLVLQATQDPLPEFPLNGEGEMEDVDEHNNEMNGKKVFIDDINSNIIVVSPEDVERYTIFDVVLPLIGSRSKIPSNDIANELEKLLEVDNLTLNNFRAREKMFASYGSYRKLMVLPKNVSWTIKQYSNPNENLVETDLDGLIRDDEDLDKKPPLSPVKSDSSDEALIVSFELPPSCYATMCLREIMKKPSIEFNNRF